MLYLRFKLRAKIRYPIRSFNSDIDAWISPNRTPILKWRRDLSSFSENFRSSFRHPLCFMTMQARRNYSVGLPHWLRCVFTFDSEYIYILMMFGSYIYSVRKSYWQLLFIFIRLVEKIWIYTCCFVHFIFYFVMPYLTSFSLYNFLIILYRSTW